MKSLINLNKNKLQVFHEGRKRRIFVGELIYIETKDQYEFTYDIKYIGSKSAIPLGADLSIFQIHHKSKKGKLFSSFIDRIPLKSNPAYKDYCEYQGISPDEKNLIILLGFIGRRGPSSFVFEPVYEDRFSLVKIRALRKQLKITQYDLAEAFDIAEVTLNKIENGKSHDRNILKLMQIFFEFPEVALWQLKQAGRKIHGDALIKLIQYFEKLYKSSQTD